MRYLDVVSTARRYARSINLERDIGSTSALEGYVLTPRGRETLGLFCERSRKDNVVRSFTVTAVYGAGKSAFMHFLVSLLGKKSSVERSYAIDVLKSQKVEKDVIRFFENLPQIQPDFICAVAVSRSESIATTLARAIVAGTAREKGLIERDVHATAQMFLERLAKNKPVLATELIKAVMTLATVRPVLLVIDELGKNLEQVAVGENDVYLLQMLAELPRQKYPIFFFGLLHSAFSEYGGRLGSKEKSEWAKIQGRFEDIPFLDSSESTLNLIASALTRKPLANRLASKVGAGWAKVLPQDAGLWAKLFPIHPLAARALPQLCARFGQNERSLFNYLTGHEPHAFHSFLAHQEFRENQPKLLKISHLYDFFIESASLADGERYSRLIELRDRIHEQSHLDSDLTEVLKTIAVLNAISSGALKATRATVVGALVDEPGKGEKEVSKRLDFLREKRIITYREQADEYRLWKGSEFDVDAAIRREIQNLPKNLAALLNADFRLRTIVAARHSYEKGTLRFFPALFYDGESIGCSIQKADGYVFYDISESIDAKRSKKGSVAECLSSIRDGSDLAAINGLPIIYVTSARVTAIRTLAREVMALKELSIGKAGIALDAVAKREVNERYFEMAERLREVIQSELGVSGRGVSVNCTPEIKDKSGTLSQIASRLCDEVYDSGFVLRNELINRQSVSSQIAKARGDIVSRMLKYRNKAGEHFSGNGPEVSIYRALTEEKYQEGLKPAQDAIRSFAKHAKEARPLSDLFRLLQQPPYGMRLGVIPLLLVKYLLENEDSISLYQEGSYIPEITAEILEILVRRPERFALKKFIISGLEAQYFDALVKAYGGTGTQKKSLLAVIKPLIRFARSLPRYTQNTRRVGEKAQKLRLALSTAREPESLIFKDIPKALGVELNTRHAEKNLIKNLTNALTQALHELQNAYMQLLGECNSDFVEALRVPDDTDLRVYLSAIAGLLSGSVLDPALRRFMNAAADKHKSDTEWLEGIIMVVADRPAESWRDEDKNIFDANLAALSQKFLNLHHLAAKIKAAGSGQFEARLVSITTPSGTESREVIWSDKAEQARVRTLKQLVEKVDGWEETPPKVKQAVLVEMLETLLQENMKAPSTSIKIEISKKHG